MKITRMIVIESESGIERLRLRERPIFVALFDATNVLP
jgi:hypothetical protein